MNRRGMVRWAMACAFASVFMMLAACASFLNKDDASARPALQEEVHEHLAQADKALKAGQTGQAMARLDAAIQADPAAKAPWLKKAQIHFDAREYGQAITQAQEVLQRDAGDLGAKSILAVSGLRVSASALAQLRKVNEVNGPARSEAEGVAKLIREALGEQILVPMAATASAPEPVRQAVRQTARPGMRGHAVRSAPTAAATASAVPTGAAEAAAAVRPAVNAGTRNATSGRSNPFGALQ